MKTVQSILTVAALLITAAAASASEPLLSPRGKANLIPRMSGVTEERLDRGIPTASPKTLANRISVAPGVTEDRLDRRLFSASPRALGNHPHLAVLTALPSKSEDGMMAGCKTMKPGECSKPCCTVSKAPSGSMPCCA